MIMPSSREPSVHPHSSGNRTPPPEPNDDSDNDSFLTVEDMAAILFSQDL
jgi:hypothetical protein